MPTFLSRIRRASDTADSNTGFSDVDVGVTLLAKIERADCEEGPGDRSVAETTAPPRGAPLRAASCANATMAGPESWACHPGSAGSHFGDAPLVLLRRYDVEPEFEAVEVREHLALDRSGRKGREETLVRQLEAVLSSKGSFFRTAAFAALVASVASLAEA